MKNIFIIITLLFSIQNSHAKTFSRENEIAQYFEDLSYEDIDFEPMGMVCERVAVRELLKEYPQDKYEILNGLQYDDKKATIGELDVVIYNKSNQKVEAVAEVKCWESFKGALKKARDQRQRFKLYLNRKIVITDQNQKHYKVEDFNQVQRYISISQEGGVNQGFDFELSLDLKELMEIRKRLLDCYAQSKCPRKR